MRDGPGQPGDPEPALAGYRPARLDLFSAGDLRLDIRKLSPDLRYRLLQMMTGSAYNITERWFENHSHF